MNQNDLYIEYARVIKMCQGTALEDKPWLCVKFNGTGLFDTHPGFTSDPELYEFAIAILEDMPVFPGDILYLKPSGLEYVADKYTTASAVDDMLWQPPKPKRTFELRGVELPCPVDWEESSNGDVAVIDGEIFWFRNKMDADLVRDTLSKIFREARDKP